MAGGAWRRSATRVRTLRVLVRDTSKALGEVQDNVLPPDENLLSKIEEIGRQASRPTALVIFGNSPSAKARLLHCILGRRLLPDALPRGCRWLRIQYGSSTQTQVTLGTSEFELVEELECNKQPWETLPVQDLIRQDPADLTTILEIELNNSFLKDGLRIIIPPDISPSCHDNEICVNLNKLHADFYSKRESILRNFTPVYLYALDRYGDCVFSENIVNSSYWTADCDGKEDYVISDNGVPAVFNAENCLDLRQIKHVSPNAQVLFVLFADSACAHATGGLERTEATESARTNCSEELTEYERDLRQDVRKAKECVEHNTSTVRVEEKRIAFMNDLLDQWEVCASPAQKHHVKSQWLILDDDEISKSMDKANLDLARKKKDTAARTVRSRSLLLNNILKFATESSQSYLLDHSIALSEIHVGLVQQLILSSFELARELQVLPVRIQYVANTERQLYETINEKFMEGETKQELVQMMQDVLQEMKQEISLMDWSVDDLPCHQDKRYRVSNSIFYSSYTPSVSLQMSELSARHDHDPDAARSPSDGEEALSYDSFNIDEYDIITSNDCSYNESSIGRSDAEVIPVERESGMLSLSNPWRATESMTCSTASLALSSKRASLDVQTTVLSSLSRKISLKLANFVDNLKDSYFGTLERCLDSLESCCLSELGGRPASEAMRQLVSVARQVDLQPYASFSFLTTLLDSIRRLFHRLRLSGSDEDEWCEEEHACCVLSPAWRRRTALRTLHTLTARRLARAISAQIIERVSAAHERYQAALSSLETALTNRLHHTEDVKLTIRKKYAPLFARLCLESTSMCDLLMYGMPELGREIGAYRSTLVSCDYSGRWCSAAMAESQACCSCAHGSPATCTRPCALDSRSPCACASPATSSRVSAICTRLDWCIETSS
ncbi:uncharacterized protein LOC126970131 isoform X2 [Leptidea sinapis]|uniref:uncharacterized protein LOC126970131 isoform X2 n=1 Tax=Leptidea sinapis TaxID=189913 RepID=UPI0021C2CEC1|nr:uncharacterized protein LOC126970131 isoform X2 [Leptidea sinapis]